MSKYLLLKRSTEAAECNSAIINCIIYTCVFPTVTRKNVLIRKKGPLYVAAIRFSLIETKGPSR